MKKIISAILATVMCLGFVFVIGCQPATDTTTIPPDTLPPAGESEPQLEVPDKTYDGADFTIYMGGQGVGINDKFNDWGEENLDYATVSAAIFKRNQQLASDYDIKISSKEDWASENGSGKSFLKVSEDYFAMECTYSMYEVGTMAAASLARSGYIYDLNKTPYINVNKPWWDQGVTKDLQIQGRMYYSTGDISVIDNLNTHNIYFNKELARELSVPDLYQLVETGEWTIDKYVEYVKIGSRDLNGDGVRDENDRYGAIIWNDAMQATFAGGGQRIATVNDDGKIELTVYNEKSFDIISKFSEVSFNREISYNYVIRLDTWQQWDPVRVSMFENDQALFFLTTLNTFGRLRNANVDFGILPYPKYSAVQEDYCSYVGASASAMICIGYHMSDEDIERNSAIIEAAAYYSKKIVTPEYYDVMLKGRFIRDEESAPCLDIIISNRIFDVGMYYLIGKYTWDLTEIMKAEQNYFASKYQEKLNTAMQEIDTLNADFLKAGYKQ